MNDGAMINIHDRVPINPFEFYRGDQHVAVNDEKLAIAHIIVKPDINHVEIDELRYILTPPIIIRTKVRVLSDGGVWLSDDDLTVLFVHGLTKDMRHQCWPYDRPDYLDTEVLAQGIDNWLRLKKLPAIDLFASCDKPLTSSKGTTIVSRWDQSNKNEIIGASGNLNFADIKHGLFVLDLINPKIPKTDFNIMSPFTYSLHVKRKLMESKFTRTALMAHV